LHSKVIDLSITAVVFGGDAPTLFTPKPLVQVAAMSALIDRPALQSTSSSMVTLEWCTKPPVEMPTTLPHDE
jgi:hypothetical protein